MGVKGNSGGKKGRSGRKSKAEELGLVATLEKCFTVKAREHCIRRLVDDCQSEVFQERHESRKLLMAYTYGKPKESIDLGNKDGEKFEVVVRHVTGSPEAED